MAKVLILKDTMVQGNLLLSKFYKIVKKKGKSCLLIGRDFNKQINAISEILRNKEVNLSPLSEIYLGIAREIERVRILEENQSTCDYIIFDRSIISVLSWIEFHNQSKELFSPFISGILDNIGHCFLIYCYLPFEESWDRTSNRPESLRSKKDEKGKDENKKMFDSFRKTLNELSNLNVSKFEIDTSKPKMENLNKLIAYIEQAS